jgi:Bacterial Ig-like domain (group 2)/Electron transfer DM13
MSKNLLVFLAVFVMLASCSKKTEITPVATVPERLEITPVSNSINIGETAQFTLKFYNNTGQLATVPTTVIWISTNNAIATVNQQGLATATGAGQTEIKVNYNSISVSALLTVVTNSTQLATVMIMPAAIQEVGLNETVALTAVGKNNSGNTISGLTFSWQSDNSSFADVNSTGTVTGKAFGSANIKATSSGIQSTPVMVQVIRKGTFAGMASAGIAKLKIENNVLTLQTTAAFSVSASPPDLRIYLGNNNNNINGALEVATLSQRSGAQSWSIAAPTTITQYRYVIVWCKQFGGTYGVADLGL